MKKLSRIFTIGLFLILGLFINIENTHAQQVGFSITPSLVTVLSKPDKSFVLPFLIENIGDPIISSISIKAFIPDGVDGGIQYETEKDPQIIFSLENQELSLNEPFFFENGKKINLFLRLTTLKEIRSGDYYYTIIVQSKNPPGKEGEINPLFRINVGSNMLITVSEDDKTDINGTIAEFNVKPNITIPFWKKKIAIFDSFDSIPIDLVIYNKGKNHIAPTGSINLVGNLKESAQYKIVPQSVLAQSQRRLIVDEENQKNLPLPHTLVLDGFFLGKYRLSTAINLSQDTGSLFATTEFYALPFKLAFAIIVMISLLIMILSRMQEQ